MGLVKPVQPTGLLAMHQTATLVHSVLVWIYSRSFHCTSQICTLFSGAYLVWHPNSYLIMLKKIKRFSSSDVYYYPYCNNFLHFFAQVFCLLLILVSFSPTSQFFYSDPSSHSSLLSMMAIITSLAWALACQCFRANTERGIKKTDEKKKEK